MEEVSNSVQSFKTINQIPSSPPTRLMGFINIVKSIENNEFTKTLSIKSIKSNKSMKSRKFHSRLFSVDEVINENLEKLLGKK